jgi:hypothetical protein
MKRVLACALLVLSAACAQTTHGGHVSSGELYATGNAAYDGYFKDVHNYQSQAAAWDDDRRNTRKALWTQLSLMPDTPDVSTLEAIAAAVAQLGAGPWKLEGQGADVKISGPEGRAEGPFFRALEATIKAERERAERLRKMVPGIGQLEHTGAELRASAPRDFNNGAFGENRQSVGQEIEASLKVVGELGRNAARKAQEADDFTSLVKRALASQQCPIPEAPAKDPAVAVTGGKKPGGKATDPKATDPKAADPKKPPPPSGGGGDMFNP